MAQFDVADTNSVARGCTERRQRIAAGYHGGAVDLDGSGAGGGQVDADIGILITVGHRPDLGVGTVCGVGDVQPVDPGGVMEDTQSDRLAGIGGTANLE